MSAVTGVSVLTHVLSQHLTSLRLLRLLACNFSVTVFGFFFFFEPGSHSCSPGLLITHCVDHIGFEL